MKPTIKRLSKVIATVALSLSLLAIPNMDASDALLMEGTIDVKGPSGLGLRNLPVTTLYRSERDPDQFYYLPPDLRFARTPDPYNPRREIPMLTVYKYNLVYNDGNFIPEEHLQRGKVCQGGTLKATFLLGLDDSEIETLEDALIGRGISRAPKIGRLPINNAEFTIVLTDPENENGPKIMAGPFPISASSDIVAIQAPLSRSATDIFLKGLFNRGPGRDGRFGDPSNPDDPNGMDDVDLPPPADPPISVLLSFDYDGHGLDSQIRVTGDWENLYQSFDSRTQGARNYELFRSSFDYSDKSSELMQDANIRITVDSGSGAQEMSNQERETLRTDVAVKIMEIAFATGGLAAVDSDRMDPGAGRALASDRYSTIYGRPVGVDVGFAMRNIIQQRAQRRGSIDFEEVGKVRIQRSDARYAPLDISNVAPRNVVIVEPSDWSVARVMAEISGDVAPFFAEKPNEGIRAQMIALTYGTSRSAQTYPKSVTPGAGLVDFGPFPYGGDPRVSVRWNLPFAPWEQLRTALALDRQRSGEWEDIRDILGQVYGQGNNGPPQFEFEGDLRLMSSFSLNKSMLPVFPELYSTSVQIFGGNSGDTVVLWLEQEIEGARNPLKVGLGEIILSGATGTGTVKTIYLHGKGVKRSRIMGEIYRDGDLLYEGEVSSSASGRITVQINELRN